MEKNFNNRIPGFTAEVGLIKTNEAYLSVTNWGRNKKDIVLLASCFSDCVTWGGRDPRACAQECSDESTEGDSGLSQPTCKPRCGPCHQESGFPAKIRWCTDNDCNFYYRWCERPPKGWELTPWVFAW